MNRPLVWVAVAMACGTYAAAFDWSGGIVLPMLLMAAGLAALRLVASRRVAQPLAVVLVFTGTGGLLWEAYHAGPPGDSLSQWARENRNAFVELRGTVRRPDLILAGREYASFILDVESVHRGPNTLLLAGRSHVRWHAPVLSLVHGDRVSVRGELATELGHVNPGVLDIEDYLRRRGIHTTLTARAGSAVNLLDRAPRWSPFAAVSRLRHAQAARLHEAVPESIYPFILAVWLGDRRDIPQEESHAYIVSGTAHILAVSGVHMAILYVTIAFFLKMLFPTRVRLRALITLGVVFTFAALTGARVSSLRAAAMIALYLLADVLDREPDAPTALGLAGIVFMVTSPDALLDVGFLLSFSSVASLLLFREPLEAWLIRLTAPDPRRRLVESRKTWRDRMDDFIERHTGPGGEFARGARAALWRLRGGISTAVAVQILPLPFAAHFFHVLPLAGPLVNLLVVPLVGVVLWMCLITTIAAFVAPPVALLVGHAMLVPVLLIQKLASLATASGAYAIVTSPSTAGFLVYWGVALGMLAALRGRLTLPHRRWAAAGCFVLCIAAWQPLAPPAEVVFLDVGHGDATFIRTPSGATMLIDAADRSEHVDRGERVVAPFLWANHVRRLNYLIITHADRDHLGGVPYILEHFRPHAVLLNALPTDRALEHELRAHCERLHIPIRRLQPGDAIRTGEATLSVLHPPPQWPEEPVNEASLVLKLEWPGMEVLLPGDIEDDGERALLTRSLRAAVLKAPHHGSITSSTPAFIDAVQPQLVVISGTDRGGRGMHETVLERYRDRDIPVLRTDIHGAITLRATRGGLAAEAQRMRRRYPQP